MKPFGATESYFIDGIVVLAMALGRSNVNPPTGRVYGGEGPGIFVWTLDD